MKVSEMMTKRVEVASAGDSIQEVAKKMAGLNAGVLPVAESGRLVGMITDRDIVMRGIATGNTLDTEVRDIMTPNIEYCFDDQDVDDITRKMGDLQIRRLPVVNHDRNLVGILSLGDVASYGDSGKAIEALEGISRPGGAHSRAVVDGDVSRDPPL